MKKYRIFMGLREMAGYMGSLQKGFDELGVSSHFLDIGGSPFAYTSTVNPGWLNFCNKWCGKIAHFSYRGLFLRILWLGIFQNFIALFFFPWAFLCHNTFIFCSNSTFFFFLELPILKLFRKKIIFVFLGSESRPAYCTGKVKINEKNVKKYAFFTHLQKLWILWVERYADCIITIPPQAVLHEKPFISIMTVGYPCRFEHTVVTATHNKQVRILHSPSNRLTKGSDLLQKIIDELHEEGLDFDYKEITGVPNQVVIEEIIKSDIILDEMYSDSPLAGLTTEAATLGRPSVIGSYYATQIQEDVSESDLPPSCFVHPDNVKKALRDMIMDQNMREDMGQKAASFVTQKWSCRQTASAYMRIITGSIPEAWWFNPADIRYGHGYGLNEEKLRQNIKFFTSAFGFQSLHINHNPHLLKFFSDLIKDSNEK